MNPGTELVSYETDWFRPQTSVICNVIERNLTWEPLDLSSRGGGLVSSEYEGICLTGNRGWQTADLAYMLDAASMQEIELNEQK